LVLTAAVFNYRVHFFISYNKLRKTTYYGDLSMFGKKILSPCEQIT